jgi:hypothetical protein
VSKPVWLLDVDGVLNASRPGWGAAPRSGWAYSAGERWRIRWAPALVSRIRTLHRSGRVEIRWCTTWCHDADQIERLLNLPPFDRAWGGQLFGAEASDAKLAAARTVVDTGRPLIWTDDAEVPEEGPLVEELSGDGRGLLIRPKPYKGLQPEHVDAIEAFIEGLIDRGSGLESSHDRGRSAAQPR